MPLPRRIFYNTIAQSLGKLFAAALGIVTIALLSRHLLEQGFGQYGTVIAFMGVFATLADLGLYLIVVREISRPDTDRSKIISNALGLRLAATLGMLLLAILLSLVLPYEPVVRQTLIIGAGAFLFVSINQVLVGIFQKHLVQHLLVLSETIGRLVNLLLVYLFIRGEMPLPFFLLALLLGSAANFACTAVFASRYEKFSIAFEPKQWLNLLSASWPLAFAVILNLLYFKTDTVILSWFHPPEAVGVYSFPYKNLEGLLAFPAMFVGLIMPLLSKTAFRDWTKFKLYLQNAFDALVIMVVPVVIATLFFAKPVLDLLKGAGAGFADSPLLMKILVLAVAAIFFGTLFSYAAVAINQQKNMLWGYLLAAALGLLWYFALIPRYGYWAAAWGTVATELIVAVYAYVLVRKASRQLISWSILWRLAPAALLLAGFYALPNTNWLLKLFLGLGVYGAAVLLFKVVPMKFIREILFLR